MRTMEWARQAGKIIALAKQKILPRQAAKTKSYRRQETTNLCLTKNFYIWSPLIRGGYNAGIKKIKRLC